jgi:hypothetical protein
VITLSATMPVSTLSAPAATSNAGRLRVFSDWGCWGQATFSLIGSVRGLWV